MIAGRRVLAVVPARSGSKGIPDKNMIEVDGRSLIAWTGLCLEQCASLDCAVISTDSERYAEEGRRHGLEAPFLRPPELSSDLATALDTVTHALLATEERSGEHFDIILVTEPTCPLRRPEDVEGTLRTLVERGADSAVAVSRADAKFHPRKALRMVGTRLEYYEPSGATVTARQTLEPLYYRNGACYAITRRCLLELQMIIGPVCEAYPIDRWLPNIDDPRDVALARFLVAEQAQGREWT